MATQHSLEEWGKFFTQYDKDNSGTLDIMEMRDLLRANNSNVSDEQIADMFVFMDGGPKGDRKITKDEFINGIKSIYFMVEEITKFFNKYDTDKSGTLSPQEFRKMLQDCDAKLSPKTMDKIIKDADTSGDGQVSLKEFIAALS